jgi:plastocyanin
MKDRCKVVVGWFLVGCGGTSTQAPPPPAVVTSLRIVAPGFSIGALRGTLQLTANAFDASGAAVASFTVAWSSLNAAAATVDASGLVTAVSNGTAAISATAGAASTTATVTVAQTPAKVVVSPAAATVTSGATATFTAQAEDSGGSAMPNAALAAWTTADSGIAGLADNGDNTATVTGGALGGPVAITAAVAGLEGHAELTVAPSITTIVWSFDAQVTTVTTTIAHGTAVNWMNGDGNTPHSIVADTAPPPSPVDAFADTSGAQTFATPGTYSYHCGIHPSMHGTLIVQ